MSGSSPSPPSKSPPLPPVGYDPSSVSVPSAACAYATTELGPCTLPAT